MSDELKPCPFCGPGNSTVSVYETEYGNWKVGCGRCGSHSGHVPWRREDAKQEAIDGWNRRTPGPATARIAEKLREYRLAPDFVGCTQIAVWITGEEAAVFLAEQEPARPEGVTP